MNNFPPNVDALTASVQVGDSISINRLFEAFDLDGDPITRIRFRDNGLTATSGFFTVNGVRQEANVFIEVNASQLNSVRYQAGLIEANESFSIQVGDPERLSAVNTGLIFTVPGNFFAPVVDTTAGSVQEREALDPTTLFTVSDPENNPIVRYLFLDTGVNDNGGHFSLNGVRQESGRFFAVEAGQLGNLEYIGGRFGQTETVAIVAFDGEFFSEIATVPVTTTANQFAPELTTFNVNTGLGRNIAAASLFNFTDADGNLPRVFGFLDTGLAANSGFFTVNGVQQPAGTFFQVPAEEINTVRFQVSDIPSSETYRIFATDGRFSSSVESAVVNSINRPTLAVADTQLGGLDIGGRTVVLNSLQEVNFSTLVSQSDGGEALSVFQVIDQNLNNDINAARLVLDGTVLARETLHTLTEMEFSRLEIRGGFQDNSSSNQFLVRGRNPLFFTEWEEFRIETVPNLNGALTSGIEYSELLDDGEKFQITFSFIDGIDPFGDNTTPPVPIYYPPDADIRDGAHPLTDAMRASVRAGLDAIETVADIEFIEVPYTVAADDVQITFGLTDGGPDNALGFTTMPVDGFGLGNELADVWFSRGFFPPEPVLNVGVGTQFFVTAIHEVGHTLGFKHPFSAPNAVPISLDNTTLSVMAGPDAFVDNPNTNIFDPVATANDNFGVFDVFEVQRIYRPNEEFNTGNDQYRFNNSNFNSMTTVYDAGGQDTFNLTASTIGETINLHQGAFSSVNGSFTLEMDQFGAPTPFGAAIAYGTVIENARGGAGNDTLIGNSVRNLLFGNAGDDTFEGDGGNDVLRGGSGDDTYIWRLGDGRDRIDEQNLGGTDAIHVFDDTALSSLQNDIVFRRFGNNLRIDFRLDRREGQGSIIVANQESLGSKIETLRLFNTNGDQIGGDIDLDSIYLQSTTEAQFFELTTQETENGFIAIPAM